MSATDGTGAPRDREEVPSLRQSSDTDPRETWSALLPELRLLARITIAAMVIAGLYYGRDILVPLALAVLLSFVLDPLVTRLKRLGLSRAPAVGVVVVLSGALIGSGALLLGNQVSTISAQLPTYQTTLRDKLQALRASSNQPGMFDGAIRTFDTIKAELEKQTPPTATTTARSGSTGTSAPAPQRVQIVEPDVPPYRQALSFLEAGSGPMATAGIVLVFVVLILLDRTDLRDRLLRLWSRNLHRSTDAMDEAGTRISKYLTMQLVVNLSYGIPMAAGLWFIGVPGAVLWGMVAAVMRFVPYVGPMASAVFPLALAFAVDPGWNMVLWTLALILTLELISNNLIEPWLYGASTGLSAMSLMVAATFWTTLWGPVGLIMSTPLTVCFLVIGRHLPSLKFLDVLLGSQPALDAPTRLYQRLLAGDLEEAIELASEQCNEGQVANFYHDTGIPVLRMASTDHLRVSTAEHRHRVMSGVDGLINDLNEQYPPPSGGHRLEAVVLGGKWEVDTLAAKMVAHALSLTGLKASVRAVVPITPEVLAQLDLQGARLICLSYFSPTPSAAARHLCKRLRRRWPGLKIVLALWNAPTRLLTEGVAESLGADAVVTSMNDALMTLTSLAGGQDPEQGFRLPAMPPNEPARLAALESSGALDARARPLLDAACRRVADIFDVPLAMVSLIGRDDQVIPASQGQLIVEGTPDGRPTRGDDLNLPRQLSLCAHVVADTQTLVIPDVARDLRFSGNPALQQRGLRFYAGAPLRSSGRDGLVIGTLCILDTEPRDLSDRDVKILESLADDLSESLANQAAQWRADAATTAIPDDISGQDKHSDDRPLHPPTPLLSASS